MSGNTMAPERADETTETPIAEEAVDIASPRPRPEPATEKPSVSAAQDTQAPAVDAEESSRGRAALAKLSNRTISIKEFLAGVVVVAIVAVVAVLAWLVVSLSSELDGMKAADADTAHAEKVALDYSAGAAEMSYEDTQGWLKRLTANTTPELGTRLRNAAGQMEQLLRPLQWSSTASPISAKVTSVDGDVYQVDAFVGIVTKNVQAPADGVETTATYKLTIDKAQDWKITAITSNGTNLNADGATPADGTPPATQNPAAPTPNQPSTPAGD
ncbi:hypothetical protein [Gordonia hydrophobica]|uniref:Mce-associated membrane protein n=1 Tax=Gordonia hydrophobica TaxID=40516 RepID=A0ABZ2U384_9ACTN|nr:hypothetical protein [Gordonia hydrophobica]MBM7367363.1 Mce-associated membrane protein [Gordonia hydrophobica]